MITVDKSNKRAELTMSVFKMDNYYVYWRQHVRSNGALSTIGYFYWVKRCSNGWNETLKTKIIKMFSDKPEKEVVTQSTNRT